MMFEVGKAVTIDSNDYMNSLPGVVLDVSASSGGVETMYTVDVEDHGTQYFYGHDLINAEESISVFR